MTNRIFKRRVIPGIPALLASEKPGTPDVEPSSMKPRISDASDNPQSHRNDERGAGCSKRQGSACASGVRQGLVACALTLRQKGVEPIGVHLRHGGEEKLGVGM